MALGVNALLASGLCDACREENWLFPALAAAQWLPPWQLQWSHVEGGLLLQNLPGMLVVSFVGLLTVLLSVASLELEYQQEFQLDGLLKVHAGAAAISALFGGFAAIVSIGRTSLNRQAGGNAISGAITAAVCMATLLAAGY